MTSVAQISRLCKHFDGVAALDDFSCLIHHQEVLGLFGPNGAGKTTLFNIITGFLPPDSGKSSYKGQNLLRIPPHCVANLGICRTFQDLRLIRHITVLENVLLAFKNQPGERLRNVFFRPGISNRQENANIGNALAQLDSAGLGGKAHDLAENLSYGQQKLLSLICCLAAEPELLLLDEPVSGIAPEMIEKILNIIRGLPALGKSVVIIEHNVEALRQVCRRLIFMDAGRKICEGAPDDVLNDSHVIEAYLE
jgi:ABC-type branched-subunit amino acid transport system ATPase component